MSKAIVVKGANFAANKVETITLSNPIPCTGISITPTAIAFDTLGATQQLTPTLTPTDTTEVVYYASSNEDVVMVSNSGLITCVGVGSATITAICGSQSATCAVASEITMTLSEYFEPYQFSSTSLSNVPPKDYAGLYLYNSAEDKRGRVYASATPTGEGRKAFSVNGNTHVAIGYYPIMMPKNTKTIEIEMAEQCSFSGKIYIFDSTKEQTFLTGDYGNKPCALVTQYTVGVPCENKVYTFQVTADGDSFAIQVGNSDITQISGNVTVTFKAD